MSQKSLRVVYAGIELEWEEEDSHYCVSIHDGFYTIDTFAIFSEINGSDRYCSFTGTTKCAESHKCTVKDVEDSIIDWLKEYSTSNCVKVQAAGIGILESKEFCRRTGEIHIMRRSISDAFHPFKRRLSDTENPEDLVAESAKAPFPGLIWPLLCPPEINSTTSRLRLPVRLWRELDVLPFLVPTAVRKMTKLIAPSAIGNIPQMIMGPRHEVEVDLKGMIRLNDADDYIETLKDARIWKVLMDLVNLSNEKSLCLCFFSSTSQGGGVALMRHALLRLLRLLEVDVHWFVAKPKPEVFEITKHKFHNVLQGVAMPGNMLTKDDKHVYEAWCKDNCEAYWNEGPFLHADVIVIDDPQLSGIIPHIKKVNKDCKLIYRSHIEIRSDLVSEPGTQAFVNWNYVWDFIKECDYFVSHPVDDFAPSCVPKEKLLFMGASTDLLDGLNKKLDDHDIEFYRIAFNRISVDQTGKRADFWHRPYITQICRFDPSKGLPDVLKAYAKFRRQVNGSFPILKIPQLIIAGAGSVDDPEATSVFNSLFEYLEEDIFDGIRHDIILARLPPCDQIMNTLLRGAWVALQLSIREGFEIKVTEAQVKGIPVIAYTSGGIPLQVRDGMTGYLVRTGDYDQVAKYLVEILGMPDLHKRLSENATPKRDDTLFTAGVAANWLYIANCVMDKKHRFGCLRKREFVEADRFDLDGRDRSAAGSGWSDLEGTILDNASSFDLVAPFLVEKFGFHIVSIDLPGHGKSQSFPPGQLYYPWELAGTLLDIVEALGWGTINILGHSRGAHVGFLFAGCFPDRVHRFIAIESVGFTNKFDDAAKELAGFLVKRRETNLKTQKLWETWSTQGPPPELLHLGKSTFETMEEAARIRMKGENPVSFNAAMKLCERGLIKLKVPASSSQQSQEHAQPGQLKERFTWSTDKKLMIRTFFRFDDDALTEIASKTTCKILLIFGAESRLWGLGTPGRESQTFKDRINALESRRQARGDPHFKTVVLTGSHHLHLEEDTSSAVRDVIFSWLI
ncbi:hypothetical protein HDU97_006650 [Phlyctochytrium planicorne]|nr:hypothetical protein HDU97_006650 [Phlyctochytrium planicorne]